MFFPMFLGPQVLLGSIQAHTSFSSPFPARLTAQISKHQTELAEKRLAKAVLKKKYLDARWAVFISPQLVGLYKGWNTTQLYFGIIS